MLRKILFSTAAALSVFTAANTQASDRFSLGLNLGGGYPVYQPAPVLVNPYPTVYAPSYGYNGYSSPAYVNPGYGNYGYANPSIGFNYSNSSWNNSRNYNRPNNNYGGNWGSNYGNNYRGSQGGFHGGHHHGCW